MPPPATIPIRRVAVVVLTWNGIADTRACLNSVADTDWPRLDVIVSDNGSSDGTPAAVRSAGLADLVVENGRNLGFAGGNNVGIAAALRRGADAILLLNNDTVVPPGAVGTMVRALDERPEAGACSPALMYAAQPTRLWFAGARFDPRLGRSAWASRYERDHAALPEHPIPIDRAAGAAMLVRREVVQEVGPLAEDLFFLYEDVDWSLRIRHAGWQILLVPSTQVAHRVSASQNGDPVTPTTAYYGTRNDLEVGRRHGTAHGLRARKREAICVLVHLAQLRRAPLGTRLECLRATVSGHRDFRRRRLGPKVAA
jgi:GT2 family glycosyltransferase